MRFALKKQAIHSRYSLFKTDSERFWEKKQKSEFPTLDTSVWLNWEKQVGQVDQDDNSGWLVWEMEAKNMY